MLLKSSSEIYDMRYILCKSKCCNQQSDLETQNNTHPILKIKIDT